MVTSKISDCVKGHKEKVNYVIEDNIWKLWHNASLQFNNSQITT
jgi:hypothetical protein